MKRIISDNQHTAFFDNRRIQQSTGVVVDKPLFVDQFKIRSYPVEWLGSVQHIYFIGAIFDYLHRYRCVNSQSFRYRVVPESVKLDNRAAEIPQDIRFPYTRQLNGIPLIKIINRTERIRHVIGIDITINIALGWRYRRRREISIFSRQHVDFHPGVIGDDNTAADMRQFRLAFVEKDRLF